MSIADSFRTMPDFVAKRPVMVVAAPLRHEINEGMKRVKDSMNGSSGIIDHLHEELDVIFPGTTRDT
jgi:hypothetical protein